MISRPGPGHLSRGRAFGYNRCMFAGLTWKSFVIVLLALLVMVVTYLAPGPRRWLNTLDLLATQLRYHARGAVPTADRLKVVGITEQTIAQFAGSEVYYPFPRDWHAAAIERLAAAGAKVVVVDILFSEADSWDEAEDLALRDAIRHARSLGCEVVLAAALERVDLAAGVHSESLVAPSATIMEAAPVLGLSNTREKLSFKLEEQVGLGLPLGENGATVNYYSQAVAAFRLYGRWQDRDTTAELDRSAVSIAGQQPGQSQQVFRINYCSPPELYDGQTYDFIRLFPELWLEDGQVPATERRELTAAESAGLRAIFDGTVVFIGSRSRADNDYFNTPFGQMYGVDTNAQAFDTLARRRLIHSVPPTSILIILAALALLSWAISGIRPIWRGSLVGAALLAVLIVGNILLFTLAGIELALSATVLGLVIPLTAGIGYGGVSEELERRRIRLIFGRYVNDQIIDQIIANPELAGLGGVERQVAVLFNDIRSYSTITEHMTPKQIVTFLNIYLAEVTEIIRTNHGFVDKFLGDGLMAFFGGPVPTRDPAGDALRAGLQIIKVLHEKVHPQITELGAPAFQVGVGIHVGPAVMGNIGSIQRHDYTLIGDAVNVASRVESQTKEFGWALVVTRDVRDAAGDTFDYELVGRRLVKGREQPVEMYRVVDPTAPEMFRLTGHNTASQ